MKKILFVNLMILLIFAGASYWTEVGRGMQKTAAQAVPETQEERSENTDEEEDTEDILSELGAIGVNDTEDILNKSFDDDEI